MTPWQIEDWHLPTRPTKTTDSRTKRWTGGESVELDAIDANQLRQICDFNISVHVDRSSSPVSRRPRRASASC